MNEATAAARQRNMCALLVDTAIKSFFEARLSKGEESIASMMMAWTVSNARALLVKEFEEGTVLWAQEETVTSLVEFTIRKRIGEQ